jgi:hypothetical protein
MTNRSHNRSNRRSVSNKGILRFVASGELVIGGGHTCPVTLQAASLDGTPPAFVEMIPRSDFAEIAVRVGGYAISSARLRICRREFTVGIARKLKNSPILWLDPSDFFAGLFPAGSRVQAAAPDDVKRLANMSRNRG